MNSKFHIWGTVFTLSFLLSTAVTANKYELTLLEDELIGKLDRLLVSPQETMETFITAMQSASQGKEEYIARAVSTLGIIHINELIRKSKGKELAITLWSIMRRSKTALPSSINVNRAGGQYVVANYTQGDILIIKQPNGNWLFSKDTIDYLPAILDDLLSKPAEYNAKDIEKSLPFYIDIRSQLPFAFKQGFLLEYWQWFGIFLVIVVGAIADKILAWIISANITRWKVQNSIFISLDNDVLRPVGLMAMALILWFGLGILDLPEGALAVLSISVKLLVSLSGIWSVFRLVDVQHTLLTYKAQQTHNRFDDLFIPMFSKSLKVFVVIVGIIFAADNLNVDVTGLVAGLGLGGLAFALAAKDLVGNFFGSLTVLLDRPFHIGDWVVIDDIEGTIEQVGFRSTRVRTFYNSMITVPNALLTTTKIDNMGARRYRRMKTILGLTYDTSPERIDAFCEGIRALIQLHPHMRKDHYQVYFNQYDSFSLGILIYVFWETPDWNSELRERHRFLLNILRLSKKIGIEFAYPTQTVYLKKDEGDIPFTPANFSPAMLEESAMEMGQREAEAIVNATLGKRSKSQSISSS